MTHRSTFGLLIFALAFTVGCGQSDTASETASAGDEDFLTDFLKEIDLAEKPLPEKRAGNALPDDTQTADSGSAETGTEVSLADSPGEQPTASAGNIMTVSSGTDVSAASGDVMPANVSGPARTSFDLVKTVQQTLVQKSAERPATATSRVQLWMSINVLQSAADSQLMELRYTRCSYQQDINGQRQSFDSQAGSSVVPLGAQPYVGLVNNGFQFRTNGAGQVVDVLQYEEFLQACGQHLDTRVRQQVLAAMRDKSQAVQRFVDETFGLLPDSNSASPGYVWQRPYDVSAQLAARIDLRCRLLALNPQTAEVNLSGQYEPTVALSDVNGVRIDRCRTLGTCTTDRSTGIPVKLNRSVYLSLTVMTPDGQLLPQEKRIETTISEQSTSTSPLIVPVSGTGPVPEVSQARQAVSSETRIPLPSNGTAGQPSAPLSSTARAVYPD